MSTCEPVDSSNGRSELNGHLSDNINPYSNKYDLNDDDEDGDLSDFNYGGWRYIKTPVDEPISFQLNSVEKLLLKKLKE